MAERWPWSAAALGIEPLSAFSRVLMLSDLRGRLATWHTGAGRRHGAEDSPRRGQHQHHQHQHQQHQHHQTEMRW